MLRRTCVHGRSSAIANRFDLFPPSGDFARISVQSLVDPYERAFNAPETSSASSEQCDGWLPVKCVVSTSMPRTRPRIPSAITHQSWPTVRRRRDSHPSIHFPRVVNVPGMKIGGAGLTRFDFGAKNSSLAATARPPTRDEARSARAVNVAVL